MTLRNQVVMVSKKGEDSQLAEEEIVTNEEEIIAEAEHILRRVPPQYVEMIIQDCRSTAEEEERHNNMREVCIPTVVEPNISASIIPSKKHLKRLRFKNLRHESSKKN